MRIDCHSHCDAAWSVHCVADYARRLGIDKVCCSRPIGDKPVRSKKVRAANNKILAAMRMYPDIIIGQCFLDPGDIRFAQEEITRCVV
ncbi:MAG: hypothetical protein KAV00_03125, partial [Phycisphaerae bacterium]|nr:hypothetical protein [Phycisphaerae bacterium]